VREVEWSEAKWSENWWFAKCLTFPFIVVFVVAGCIVYVLAVLVSFIVVFLYCVCALNVCNLRYLSVLLLYYCHRAKAKLQFNKCDPPHRLTCWANFHVPTCNQCSWSHVARGLPALPMQFLPHFQGMLRTHRVICWGSLSRFVLMMTSCECITVPHCASTID
jgi:hypothetical protein